ncbi:hypothetical protein [Rhodoplanes sp.]|uniref:hypothetical protein n=1 Tax=Rhodoplanes sp. TaxID=1968906 RepID=UPI0025D7769E|nr:hypothetical protein [Rhodoplanes sp.]
MSDAIGDARPSTDTQIIAAQGKNRLNPRGGLAPQIVMDHILVGHPRARPAARRPNPLSGAPDQRACPRDPRPRAAHVQKVRGRRPREATEQTDALG